VIQKITIEVIEHRDQRYNTVGDWRFVRDSEGAPTELTISVSNIQFDNTMNMLIALHEFVEAILCELGGVKEKDVDQFDLNWKPRPVFWDTDRLTTEPGEDYMAPYYSQHQLASAVERLCADRLYQHWGRYEAIVDKVVEDAEVHFAEKALDQIVIASEIEEPVGVPAERAPGASATDFDDDIPF